jgi:hypothetical protein
MAFKFNPFTGKLDIAGLAGGGSPAGPAGGDLAGTYPNPTVDGLQGRPVSNATPVNGQVLQYDGTNWVPGSIPSGGSGGGGVVYYLNFNTAADTPLTNIPQTPNASKELGIIGDVTATSYLSPILSTGSYDFLASFVTDVSNPSSTAIPAGIWDFNIFVESTTTNSANQIYFKIEILKYDGTNAPTLLATSNDTYIYDPAEINQYIASVVMPQTTILSTDRIVVYLYGRAHQNNNRLTFHFGGNYPSHTHSTIPSVTGTGVVKVVNGVFQSPATTIVNADVSPTAAIAVSKLSQATARILGRTTAGTGAVEEITVGTGLSLSAGTLTNTATITTGAVDNAILRADGTGGATLQNSDLNIDDATVTTQANVAITNQHSGQTNSALVLTPKGTGAFIAGPKPDGTATGGNARGSRAVDLQLSRTAATQVASGANSVICGGINNTASDSQNFVGAGTSNSVTSANNSNSAIVGGNANSIVGGSINSNAFIGSGSSNSITNSPRACIVSGNTNAIASLSSSAFLGAGVENSITGADAGVIAGGYWNVCNTQLASILGGRQATVDRYGMQAHANGSFGPNNTSGSGQAQRARFVLRCKTTTNTGVEMALDGATTYLGIPSGKIIACTINITGSKSDGTAVAHYLRQYCVKNVGGTSSQVYAPVTIGTDNAAGTTIALSANNADDTLRILVTGITSETWRWVASVDAVEVTYGT